MSATETRNASLDALDWSKGDGLLPVVVQHAVDGRVLMLGYMNSEALEQTVTTGHVTFYSRSKQRLWMKGESSGHVLVVESIAGDCDRDTVLVLARPKGPTCHEGTDTCFAGQPAPAVADIAFLSELEQVIRARIAGGDDSSYTAKLYARGVKKVAQKVGEEGLEVALAAVAEDDSAFLGECADLLFHLEVLLQARGMRLGDVAAELARRHADRTAAD
jgi:phosphoribosyl-ATP pyrophosphohydrolase/phosphoribosyl-AMP cyclohydrolase